MAFLGRFSRKKRAAARRKKAEGGAPTDKGPAATSIKDKTAVGSVGESPPSAKIDRRSSIFSAKKLLSHKQKAVNPPEPVPMVSKPTKPAVTENHPVEQPVVAKVAAPRSPTSSTLCEIRPISAGSTVHPRTVVESVSLPTINGLIEDGSLEPNSLPEPRFVTDAHSVTSKSSQSACSQLTDLTQIDDGLTDWGLPKVFSENIESEVVNVDETLDVHLPEQALPAPGISDAIEEYLSSVSSVKEWLSVGEPSAIHASKFPSERLASRYPYATKTLLVVYMAMLLKRSGVVPPRYRAQEEITPATSSYLFVPWL